MMNFFQRLTLLTGDEAAAALARSRVLVVGLGGVGSWCAEALVRSGVGAVSLADFDTVSATNINRQVEALSGNIGRLKTEALKERLEDINPSCEVTCYPRLFSRETAELFDIPGADFVIDAIDTLSCKLDLIEITLATGKRLFSSMGMAWKLDPTRIKIADIWETSGCPLARLVRQGLRERGFSGHFTAVYSPERVSRLDGAAAGDIPGGGIPDVPNEVFLPVGISSAGGSLGAPDEAVLSAAVPIEAGGGKNAGGIASIRKKPVNGSCVTVTATAGMILASLVIRDVYAKFRAASFGGKYDRHDEGFHGPSFGGAKAGGSSFAVEPAPRDPGPDKQEGHNG